MPGIRFHNFQRAPSTCAGGTVYAGDPGQTGLSWGGQSMWMPRVSGSWSINERTVFKGGYGMYYDVLSATNFTPNQLGYSATTANVASVDFGQTWLLGDPKRGISPMSDPFPMRASGTRFDAPLGNSLGVNTALGTRFQAQNPNRVHPRVQRWRASVQREISRNMAVEIAYNGSRGDRLDRTIRQDYLPEEWWNGSNVRDVTQQNLLNANVTNPFLIGNFDALRTSNPALYNQMAGNSFFTSPTIQRNRLLRPFPHMSSGDGLDYLTLPLGENRAHSLELSFNRRFANGFTTNFFYTATKFRENRTVEEYDREPTIWQTSQDSRPHRVTADFIAELPFGSTKPFLNDGGVLAAILSDWQVGGTYEWQPGALLEWPGNIFFYGDLDDIKLDNPTIERWFNTDAGFEKDPAKVPANVPEARVPVPDRRRARAGPSASEHEHRPDGAAAGQQDAAVPRGRAQRLQQRDVRHAEPEPDLDAVRHDHGQQRHLHAVRDVRDEVQLLASSSRQAVGLRTGSSSELLLWLPATSYRLAPTSATASRRDGGRCCRLIAVVYSATGVSCAISRVIPKSRSIVRPALAVAEIDELRHVWGRCRPVVVFHDDLPGKRGHHVDVRRRCPPDP